MRPRESVRLCVHDGVDAVERIAAGEPLQMLDRSGRVVYIGSYSKTMLPTLRIGFAIVPDAFAARNPPRACT